MRLSKRLVQAYWWEGLIPAHWWVKLVLFPLTGMALLRKTLSSLSADEWCCVPAPLVVWSEMSHHWSLQAVE